MGVVLPMVSSDDAIVAITERDGVTDCIHRGSGVVVDCNETVLWRVGDERRVVFERSTTKPFRALALIRAGGALSARLEDPEIALIAGSHSGSSVHVACARSLLVRFGLSEGDLRCGVRPPLGQEALDELLRGDRKLSSLECDCSGEHIGALILCRVLGYPIDDYLAPAHPVQTLFARTIGEFGTDLSGVASVDRCGMPTSAVRLTTIAVRMARLMRARLIDESVDHLLRSIVQNPMMYTGVHRIVGEIINTFRRRPSREMRSRGSVRHCLAERRRASRQSG